MEQKNFDELLESVRQAGVMKRGRKSKRISEHFDKSRKKDMSKDDIKQHMGDYHAELIEALKDSDEALSYLKVALEEYEQDKDLEALKIVLKNLAEAGMNI